LDQTSILTNINYIESQQLIVKPILSIQTLSNWKKFNYLKRQIKYTRIIKLKNLTKIKVLNLQPYINSNKNKQTSN